MKTRECIAWGAIVGISVSFFTLSAVTRGPGPDTPGEATTSVLGVVVDRISIPANPDGRAGMPTDRFLRGVFATMIGTAVASGGIGGAVGWAIGRSTRRRPSA